jgi:copper(I)-binding protein
LSNIWNKKWLSLLALTTLNAAAAGNAVPMPGDKTHAASASIENAWVRAMPPSQANTAAYLTLENTGQRALKIVGAHSHSEAVVEIHSSGIVDGLMTMQAVDVVEVAAGNSVEFGPGGMHLMIMGLEKMPAPGEQVKLCLEFESASPLCVDAAVRKVAPAADDDAASNQHHH